MNQITSSTLLTRRKPERRHIHEKINNTPPSPFGLLFFPGNVIMKNKKSTIIPLAPLIASGIRKFVSKAWDIAVFALNIISMPSRS
jgi:hypothetical protein